MSFDYRGFFHIHSAYSHDGTTDIKDIIKSAQKSGADFIILTDHFNLKAKEEGYEGYHGSLLVIAGEEISPSYNHYLAVGIKEPVSAGTEEKPQKYIDEVRKQGGAGLIAHPDHTGTKLFGVRSYAWKDWNVTGYDAVSIWDLMTDWQEKLTSYPKALFSFLFPALALSGPKKETLERWDGVNVREKEPKLVAGYGEVDNHDFRKKVFGMTFRIFPFKFAFRTVSTHIVLSEELSKDPEEAKKQVIDAVKNSKLYVAQEKWDNAKGFEFFIADNLKTVRSGQTLSAPQSAVLNVKLPQTGLIKAVHNGNVLVSQISKTLAVPVSQPGVYRVEVYRKKFFSWKPWIFSNHIKIK